MKVEIELPNGKDYLSYSSSSKLYQHPLSYQSYSEKKDGMSGEMIFGQYYEDMLYDRSLEQYLILDEKKIERQAREKRDKEGKKTIDIRRTNEYSNMKKEFIDSSDKPYIIPLESKIVAEKMKDIMVGSYVFDSYLKGQEQVTSCRYIDTGDYEVKALVKSDVLTPDSCNDLKTTSTELRNYVSHAKKMNLDIQAYLSLEVTNSDKFNFVIQRTNKLNDIAVINVDRDGWFYESGRKKFNEAINNYLSFFSPQAREEKVNLSHYVIYQNI